MYLWRRRRQGRQLCSQLEIRHLGLVPFFFKGGQGLLQRPAPGEPLIRLPRDPAPRPRVPLHTLLEAILQPGGDFTVWYFPWRLVLDVGLVAANDPYDQFARRYASLTHLRDTRLPMLIVGAGHGLVRSSGATEYYRRLVATPPSQVMVKIFPDYSHLDIEDADPNPVVPMILAWLRTVVH